jgi:hypothetical protein
MRMEMTNNTGSSRKTTVLLWTIQGLLAALFLFAGGMKLAVPIEAMTQQIALPGWFLRFIGVAEVLGAVGLVLPGLLHSRPGATVITLQGGVAQAIVPIIVGILLTTVAYGRRQTLHLAR